MEGWEAALRGEGQGAACQSQLRKEQQVAVEVGLQLIGRLSLVAWPQLQEQRRRKRRKRKRRRMKKRRRGSDSCRTQQRVQ